jgi:hypothetical protein
LKLDISEYILQNKISKENINNYYLIIEGESKTSKNNNKYTIYNQKEIIQDGDYKIIIN